MYSVRIYTTYIYNISRYMLCIHKIQRELPSPIKKCNVPIGSAERMGAAREGGSCGKPSWENLAPPWQRDKAYREMFETFCTYSPRISKECLLYKGAISKKKRIVFQQ